MKKTQPILLFMKASTKVLLLLSPKINLIWSIKGKCAVTEILIASHVD